MTSADRVLLRVSTPLHPSPAQTVYLQWLVDTAAALYLALQHTAGMPAALPAALQTAATGAFLPPAPPPAGVSPELEGLVRAALPAAWAAVPDALIRGVVRAFTQDPSGRFRPQVELDTALVPVDAFHVHVTGLRDLLVADLWRQPLGVSDVLLADGFQHQAALAAQVQDVLAADQHGDRWALAHLARLARQVGPRLHRGLPASVADAQGAERVYATLRPYRALGGTSNWTVTWGVRVPTGFLPDAYRDDTVGVDVGVHHLISWVSGTHAGQVPAPRLPTGAWRAPTGDVTPLAAAAVRHAQFQRWAAELDRTLRALLTYRRVAIEGTHWRPLDGTPELEAMALSGMTEVAHWLSEFGRVTGTRVERISPWQGSGQCGQCGRAGRREKRQFHCPACGSHADADLNAAAWYRRQALRGT